MKRILLVCLGNICRSPIAEGVLREKAVRRGLDLVIDSAGTASWHVGRLPDRRAIAAAARRGYDISTLRARQVRSADFADFDLILAMDESNLADLEAMRPPGAPARIKLLLDNLADPPMREVPDPYYDDRFDLVLDLVEEASEALLDRLEAMHAAKRKC